MRLQDSSASAAGLQGLPYTKPVPEELPQRPSLHSGMAGLRRRLRRHGRQFAGSKGSKQAKDGCRRFEPQQEQMCACAAWGTDWKRSSRWMGGFVTRWQNECWYWRRHVLAPAKPCSNASVYKCSRCCNARSQASSCSGFLSGCHFICQFLRA